MKTQHVFKTEDNTILIVTASTGGCAGRSYVSVTANEIGPILKSDAISQSKERLEDGELWRMAVAAEQTEMGLDDWIDTVLSIDGELSQFDNSLYDNEIEIDGDSYIFDSIGCGRMHDTINEATPIFKRLNELHLEDSPKALKEAEKIILTLQKQEADIDFMVEKYTREILEINA